MSNPATFINVVDIDPAKLQEVIDLLTEGGEKVMSRRPGFISVTLLASLDKSRVINVARWESAEDIKATQSDPEAAEYAEHALDTEAILAAGLAALHEQVSS